MQWDEDEIMFKINYTFTFVSHFRSVWHVVCCASPNRNPTYSTYFCAQNQFKKYFQAECSLLYSSGAEFELNEVWQNRYDLRRGKRMNQCLEGVVVQDANVSFLTSFALFAAFE